MNQPSKSGHYAIYMAQKIIQAVSSSRRHQCYNNLRTFSGRLREKLKTEDMPLTSSATIGGYVLQDIDHFNTSVEGQWKQVCDSILERAFKPKETRTSILLQLSGEGDILYVDIFFYQHEFWVVLVKCGVTPHWARITQNSSKV